MNYLSIDHIIVYASILITLIVGLRAGKGIKTIRDYAVGNKTFGTTSLVFTYLATNLSGASIINAGSMIFSDGIIVEVALLGLIITFVIRAFFIAPHAVHFPNCITMGDMMKQLYGSLSGLIAGTLGLLSSIFYAGMQLIVLGIICDSLLGIPARQAILVGGFILTLYSAHGGIKSVVTTDVLQFLMAVVGIPLIACIGVGKVGGISALFQQVPAEKWMIFDHPKFCFYGMLFLLWTVFPAGMIDSAIIQRLLMGKTKQQLRNQYLVVAFFDPLFRLLVLLISLSGIVLYPEGPGKEIVPRIINDFFPIGFKGLAIMGLLAIVMSTVDSYLHVTGLTMVHDVIKPIYGMRGKILLENHEKYFAQFATVLVGMATIAIGLHTTDMFSLFLDALETTGPILMFPLLAGMMGLKPEKKAFYTAMFVTIVTWIMCKLFLPKDYSYLRTLVCILANGIAFFGTHWYLNKGFKKSDRRKVEYLSDYHTAPAFFDRLPQRIYAYVKNQCECQEGPYMLAGIFCLINLTIPYFFGVMQTHSHFVLPLNGIGAILCGLLIAQEKSSYFFQRKYIPFLFYFTLFYCLPFTSILMFVISHGDSCWLANLLVSLTFLVVLVDWGMIILLSLLGIGCNLLLCAYVGPIHWEWQVSYTFFMACQIVLALVVAILFSHRKQKQYQQLAHTCQQLMLTHSLWETDYLYSLQYQALQKKHMELQKEPFATAKAGLRFLAKLMPLERSLSQRGLEQLDAFVNYYTTSFYHSMDAMQLKLSTCSLKELLGKINLALHDATLTNRIVIELPTKQQNITCDVEKIVQLLANHLKELEKQIPPEYKIQLAIHDTELCYRLQVVTQKEWLRKLPALAFMLYPQGPQDLTQEAPPLESSYMGTTTPVPLAVPKTAVELPERNQAQVIEAHYGYHKKTQSGGYHEEIKPQGGEDINYRLVVLPVSVDAIRSAIVDKDPLPKEFPLETPESFKIEQDFLDQLAQSFCVLDETIARDAIHMIKYAHQGQRRKSGEPFYTHPLQVAMILLTITKDSDAILAALLHDVIEDTAISLDQIAYQYGRRVAYLVQTLTHLDPTGKKTKLTEAENHAQLAAAENKEAVLIKLADRLHNMRTIAFHKPEKQRYIAQETLEFYVPLGKTIKEPAVQTLVEELKTICEVLVKG